MDRLLKVVKLVLLLFLAVALPPAAVAVKRGFGRDFFLNILFLLLLWLPAAVCAVVIVLEPDGPDALPIDLDQ